jgi:uncharacterized membrane protein
MTTILANMSLTIDPAWPWSIPDIGLAAFAGVALALVALTLWTYRGVQGVTWRRVLGVLALRLLALVVACLVILRPSLAEQDDAFVPSKLLILVDASASMTISDEFNNLSRWDNARRILRSPAVDALLKRLQNEQHVELVFYQGAEDVGKFDPDGKAEGKRTDIGQWLHSLQKMHGGEQNLRGLLIFSDGADNGTRYPTLDEAARWRSIPCPIHSFALGRPTTSPRQHDIALVSIHTDPAVPVKTKITVKAVLNAPGFEGASVNLSLLIDGKLAAPAKRVTLPKTTDNEVQLTCDAPDRAGEVKVTLRADPLQGEVTTLNNEISTYVTLTKEGLSVLWVEGKKRAYESVFVIRHVLSRDPRFRVYYAENLDDNPPPPDQADWFDFAKQHYDVIVIGDVSAKRFARGNPGVFKQIGEMVRAKGTGLLMLGGNETFANSDWQTFGAELADLLPVKFDAPGQVEGLVRMEPTPAGLQNHGYLLRLTDQGDGRDVWDRVLDELDGMTRLGSVRPDATVLATKSGGEPVLVGGKRGEGRTLAFAGDTTWKAWRRSLPAIAAYERFWKQVVLWLARQEAAEGNLRVIPDTRRLAAGNNERLGFSVGLTGKGGVPVKDPRFTVKVIGPQKDVTEVATAPEHGLERGSFWKTNAPGEYVIEATGTGKDADGAEVKGTARARFLAYAQDLETLRPGADHDLLAKLAAAGGGKFHLAGERELVQFLEELRSQPGAQGRPKAELWPDWRRNPASDSTRDQVSALWMSGALVCFLVFTSLLCVEWFLRRRCGMV